MGILALRSLPRRGTPVLTTAALNQRLGLLWQSFLPLIQPPEPLLQAVAPRTRDSHNLHARMHPTSVLLGLRDIKRHIRQQIGLRDYQQLRLEKDGRILQRLVFAFGHTQQNNLRRLAQVVARRANQVTDILNKEQLEFI